VIANTTLTGTDDVFRVSYDYSNLATDTGLLTVTNQTTGASQTVDINAIITAKRTQPAAGDLTNNLNAGDTVDVSFGGLGITLRLDSTFDVDTDILPTLSTATGSIVMTAAAGTLGGTTTGQFLNNGGVTGAQLAAMTTINSANGQLAVNVTYGANTLAVAATTGLEFSRDGVTWAGTLATSATNVGTAAPIFIRATGATNAFASVNLTATTTTAGNGTINLDVSGMFRNTETTSATKTFSFKVGTGVTVNDSVAITINGVTTAALGVSTSTIDTAANADAAISAVNTAISTISSRRADIGSSQSRLEFANASIAVSIENTTAATSALMDVDVSSEITNFTSKQVLLQAGVSLLAQANQQPALLLRLLQ